MDTKNYQTEQSRQDPSSLTTAQLQREITGLKELIFSQLESLSKAVDVAHNDLVRVPTDVQKQVAALKELHEKWFIEKFDGIEKQFLERDVRVEQTARDTKTAVDAALAAQEKAVGKQNESFTLSITKSENATAKQIDQQGLLIQQNAKAFDDKITDIKDRITTIEGIAAGVINTKTSQQTSSMSAVNIIGLIVGTLIAIAGIVIGIMSR